jgi:hypothetical protein
MLQVGLLYLMRVVSQRLFSTEARAYRYSQMMDEMVEGKSRSLKSLSPAASFVSTLHSTIQPKSNVYSAFNRAFRSSLSEVIIHLQHLVVPSMLIHYLRTHSSTRFPITLSALQHINNAASSPLSLLPLQHPPIFHQPSALHQHTSHTPSSLH